MGLDAQPDAIAVCRRVGRRFGKHEGSPTATPTLQRRDDIARTRRKPLGLSGVTRLNQAKTLLLENDAALSTLDRPLQAAGLLCPRSRSAAAERCWQELRTAIRRARSRSGKSTRLGDCRTGLLLSDQELTRRRSRRFAYGWHPDGSAKSFATMRLLPLLRVGAGRLIVRRSFRSYLRWLRRRPILLRDKAMPVYCHRGLAPS